jgi:diacylglycerol kinase (ATP)
MDGNIMENFRKIIRSFQNGAKGISRAYHTDKSFRLEINWGLPIYLVVGWFLSPIYLPELLFYVFSYLFILAVELINTSIEVLLSRVHPEEHTLIGESKDIASGAVLVSFINAAIVVGVMLVNRFMQ